MPPAPTDQDDLGRFGYAQELFRSMGGFSNFAISFSIISILTGAVTLYGYGLEMGGPLEMTLGWPLATVFTLTVAASMAELCSAYPTAGAMYHWAADLGGRQPQGLQADLHSEGGASHAHRFPPAHSDRHRWEFRLRIKIAQFAERDLEALPHLG